jgi:hypothetical protein
MIASVFDFITSRKWLMELILLAIIVLGVWWLCEHLIGVGVQRQKDADAKALAQVVIDNAKKEAVLQTRANQAEASYAKEHQDLVDYRASQPLHGGLCNDQGRRGLSEGTAPHARNDRGSPTASDLQPVPAGGAEIGGHADPDIRHLLDVFAGRADEVSSALREYQHRN